MNKNNDISTVQPASEVALCSASHPKRTFRITYPHPVGAAGLRVRELTTQVATKRELWELLRRSFGNHRPESVEILDGPEWSNEE